MSNLEKLLKIEKLTQENLVLNEYIKVLIEIEKEYYVHDEIGDTCRNGKDWNKCECC